MAKWGEGTSKVPPRSRSLLLLFVPLPQSRPQNNISRREVASGERLFANNFLITYPASRGPQGWMGRILCPIERRDPGQGGAAGAFAWTVGE